MAILYDCETECSFVYLIINSVYISELSEINCYAPLAFLVAYFSFSLCGCLLVIVYCLFVVH